MSAGTAALPIPSRPNLQLVLVEQLVDARLAGNSRLRLLVYIIDFGSDSVRQTGEVE